MIGHIGASVGRIGLLGGVSLRALTASDPFLGAVAAFSLRVPMNSAFYGIENLVSNPEATGAVVGNPGTAPTDWVLPAANGLGRTVVSVGTIDGMNYVDVRWSGTSTATGGITAHFNNLSLPIGTVTSGALSVALVGGTLANVGGFQVRAGDGGAGQLGFTPDAVLKRYSFTQALATQNAKSASLVLRFSALSVGAPVDFTLRLAFPVLVEGTKLGNIVRVRRSSDNAEADFGTRGPQKALNRNFATDTLWNKGANVTISGGAMVCGANVFTIAGQDMGLVVGRTYKVSMIVNKQGSTGVARIRTSTNDVTNIEGANLIPLKGNAANGLQIYQATITATGPCLIFASDLNFWAGSIFFVSVQDAATVQGQDRWLDEYAVLGFVEVNSGAVATCYDHTGNDLHATQISGPLQPRIVNAGVLDTQNGKPALYTSVAGQRLETSWALGGLASFGGSAVLTRTGNLSPGVASLIGGTNHVTSAAAGKLQWRASGNSAFLFLEVGSGTFSGTTPVGVPLNQAAVASFQAAPAGSAKVSLNGYVSSSSATPFSSVPMTADPFYLLGHPGNGSRGFVGYCSEFILFGEGYTDAAFQALTANQGAAFGVTL